MRNVSVQAFWAGLGAVIATLMGGAGAGDAQASPLPGMTARTNSQACIDKFRELYTISGNILTSVPAATSVQRLDILTGGIPVKSGFEAIGRGRKYDTEYYSLESTYAIPGSDEFVGAQSIYQNYENPTKLEVYQNMTLKVGTDTRLYLWSQANGCEATDQFGRMTVSLNKGVWPNPSCSLWVEFDKSQDDSLCSDGSKSIQTLLTEKKPDLPDMPRLSRSLYASNGSGTLSAAARSAIEGNGWTVSGNYLVKELTYNDVSSDSVVDTLVATLPTSGSNTYVNSTGATGSTYSAICSPEGVQDTNCFSLSSEVQLDFSNDGGWSEGVYCYDPSDWDDYSNYWNQDWQSMTYLQQRQANARADAFQWRRRYNDAVRARTWVDDLLASGLLKSVTVGGICDSLSASGGGGGFGFDSSARSSSRSSVKASKSKVSGGAK